MPRLFRRLLTVLLSVTAHSLATAQVRTPGISSELAETRSRVVSDCAYRLSFTFEPGSHAVSGHVQFAFRLSSLDEDLLLDFTGELLDATINAVPSDLQRTAEDHYVLEQSKLTVGLNTFNAKFLAVSAPTGAPLTVYTDPKDGLEYFYTLLVPSDAHQLFPCFDQPDLKARFQLEMTLPKEWVGIANGDVESVEATERGNRWTFVRTAPLSTYLFAFAAGPFAEVVDERPSGIRDSRTRPMRMFLRRARVEETETNRLFSMHRESLAWLQDYFGADYPFGKLDFVLIPGFPYGGMEHAGAIFYRESALTFDHTPTASEEVRRSTLVYHEVAHQWFGNLVTMKWFDDLWLKEGFATFIAYTLLENLEPDQRAWLRFHQRVKPRAYAVDQTRGTVPIRQELENLADAKSAYGAIVYNKAPAVLRQLQAWIGPAAFQRGVRSFLRTHAFGNAVWQDLVGALEAASSKKGANWSNRWILRPGLPSVRARWSVDDAGKIRSFTIEQEGRGTSADNAWPLDLEVALFDEVDSSRTAAMVLEAGKTPVATLIGEPAPQAVLLNPRDVAYGLFVLDERSAKWLLRHAQDLDTPLRRAVAYAALRETMRQQELAPELFADFLVRLLPAEEDPQTHSWVLDNLATVLERYLPAPESIVRRQRVTEVLVSRLVSGKLKGRELETFRFLAKHGTSEFVTPLCESLLAGDTSIAGLELGAQDRFLAAASIYATTGSPTAIEKLQGSIRGDTGKYNYLARAATGDPDAKAAVFDSYFTKGEKQIPEQWVQDSLPFFHWRGQQEQTLPFLRRALERVDWVKRNRKIFFMPAWLDAFINGHSSPEALSTVETWLDSAELDVDVRRKVLQSLDDLVLAVRLRGH